MIARGRIGKRRPHDYDGPDWVSRDYALVVKCACTACPVNTAGHCGMPSVISIGADGRCLKGKEFKVKAPVQPTRTVCKWCGGEIRKKAVVFSFDETRTRRPELWEHVGEKMSHPAEPRGIL